MIKFSGIGFDSIVKDDTPKNKNIVNNKFVWNTDKLYVVKSKLENGDIIDVPNPFFENNLNAKKQNIVYEYTENELLEYLRCEKDILAFAESYCKIKTEKGAYTNFKLRDYQKKVLNTIDEKRFVVYLASRQIGKSVMSGIFINKFICYNTDKNILIMANKAETMEEIIEKIWNIYLSLPYFIKPGVVKKNQSEIRFDNGCKIFGQATTKSASVGFTVDFAYLDEFAKIPDNIADEFYTSIFPTLSSLEDSKMIITSTADGLNKFYEIYSSAVEGRNSYTPLITYWHEVPGRGEEWKQKEIADLGSEDAFNKEYNCEFLVSSSLLLDSETLKNIKNNRENYVHYEIDNFIDSDLDYYDLVWNKNDFDSILENRNKDCYILSIDLGKGVGGDYSVINIFKLMCYELSEIEDNKFKDIKDFIKYKQVGLYRNNTKTVRNVAEITIQLIIFLGLDNVKIVLENNSDGDYFYDIVKNDYEDFFIGLFVKTKHRLSDEKRKIGVRVTSGNKTNYCLELKRRIRKKNIIFDENETINEMLSFGLTKSGTYQSQTGHDDIAMSMVNLNCIFGSYEYIEICETFIEQIELDVLNQMYDVIEKSLEKTTSEEEEQNEIYKIWTFS